MNYELLEPVKYYKSTGKQTHLDNTTAYFDELLTKSRVDVEANRQTVREYNAQNDIIKNLNKKIRKYKILKGFLIFGIILGAILAIVSFALFSEYETGTGALLLLLGAGLIGGCIYAIKKKITPKIKDISKIRDQHAAKASELLALAEAQVAPLNALFNDTDTFRLIEKTIPDFKFNTRFTKAHEALFMKQYDFIDLQNDECSMIDTVSGSFAGNPFVFGRRRVHRMGTYTYTGSLVIHWTETYRDSEGNLRTRSRSETLFASLTKPKPYYHTNTFLSYGSQAAPDLTFTHNTQHSEDLSEKQLERKIQKGEKQFEKQARKALKNGGTFQEMANSEFDVLFGARDRNHEVQFRLMFTPLAQNSMVDLLTDKEHYGDDFDFIKNKRCNTIISDHAQNWCMNTSAIHYYSHDVDQIKKNFTDFNTTYFKSVFFDFAPLFSVPAYIEEPCASLEDVEDFPSNHTYYEHEVMANAIGYERFVHEDSRTEAILKTQCTFKKNKVDNVLVTAHSYAAVDRLDFVPVRGGDGKMHLVPVAWVDYIPLVKNTDMSVSALDLSEKEFREKGGTVSPGEAYVHGLNAQMIIN